MSRVIVGVDPHKKSVTIEAVDEHGLVLARGRYGTDTASYRTMVKYVRAQWPEHRWAVEGAHGVGRPLAQRLLAQGEVVVDVSAKLAARVRVFDTGNARKTDATDAHAVAMVALRTSGLRQLAFDEELLALRLLTDRRDELAKLRVQTVNRLHRLLTELIPGGANKRDLSALQAKRLLATVKPRSLLRKTIRRMAVEEVADLVAVDAKLKAIKKELKAAVLARGSHLMDLFGVGPAVAARVLADVGDVARFPDRNHFASWTGTAPLDASSGEQIRHRLSRAGNRRMNHVIHIAAIVQIRHDTEGRAYYRRKLDRVQDPDGSAALPQTPDLRRGLPPARRRRRPQRPDTRPWRGGPGRALGGVFEIQRGRPAHPGHRLFGSATSRTRNTDATPGRTRCEPPRGLGSSAPAPTRQSRQGAAPHRTNDLDGDKRRRTLQKADTAPLTQRGTRSGRMAAARGIGPG